MTQLTEELPEHRHYHLLRNGETEPTGPYSQGQLFQLFETEQIRTTDYVYFGDWDGWKRFSQVFDVQDHVISHFVDGEQDPHVVKEVYLLMEEKALPGEELYYIGVQHLPALSITAAVRLTMPKSIVVTSHRFVIVEPKLVGDTEIEEFARDDVESAVRRIKANSKCGTFSLVLRNGEWIELNKIPAAQLKRLEELSRYILSH